MFELDRVTRRYGPLVALDAVSLRFETGSVTAVVGTSGSGKSTLLRLLPGLERPDVGLVRIDGAALDYRALAPLRHRIGYVIQQGGLFPHLDVRDNLALLPRYLGWPHHRIDARIAELAALMQLSTALLDRRPTTLSGGQRQRVALMRALMTDPPALLLDEPLGAVDPVTRHRLQDELRDLFARLGKTVLLVTHDLAEAAYLAPDLVLMHAGRVVQRGSIDDLRLRPADAFVERFVAARRTLPGVAG
jgi:osmoprotectant transport system ATP-binding protein